MFFALALWLEALFILLPAIVDGLSWATTQRYYRTRQVPISQKSSYFAGLTIVSASTLVYLGYFAWRICALYQVRLPLHLLIALDRSLFPAALLSSLAIVCLLVGKGPYRFALAIAALWIAMQIWIHHGIIHWA